jgi:6-pyruvoyltetrahydropterin/6-carboxytetrahydropterin synthase
VKEKYMFKVGVKHEFNASHALVGDFGDETIPHSHTYMLDWNLAVRELDENGFSMNIANLEEAIARTAAQMDGLYLNDQPFFTGRQPSVENMAVYLDTLLNEKLESLGEDLSRLMWTEVRIWENDYAWASYEKHYIKEERK